MHETDKTDLLLQEFNSPLFKSLGEPVRTTILQVLLLNGRSDIDGIAQKMPQDRSVISRHLSQMHSAGILHREKVGRHVYYQLNASQFVQKFENITELMKQVMSTCCPE